MRDQDRFLQRALLDLGIVDQETIEVCVSRAQEEGQDLATALIDSGAVEALRLALVKADVCEVPFVDLSDYDPCFANSHLIPRSVAERYCVFPLFFVDDVLTLATDDPMDLNAMDHVRQLVKGEVDAVLCERAGLEALIHRVYSLSSGHQEARAEPRAERVDATEIEASSQPIVAAVNQLLADAANFCASDIHINPDENTLRIRYRVDGVLQEKQGPPLAMHPGIVQRLKVMANLDLTQTRRPQDGKFRFRHEGENIDVRLSTLPTVCGENVVLRLLSGRCPINSFGDLGVPGSIADQLGELLSRPHGMVLVTGPTGSGKTTTLYTALNQINDPSTNIITVEDPVEIRLPYVRQVQVHTEIGLTFASALRAILRQDPDVVLLGEIRDLETASIALQAALTGHLVLSTVHTNDAAGAVSRLTDFGLPPFVINSAVLGVLAQRLVRRVCTSCTRKDQPDALTLSRFGLQPGDGQFTKGDGCSHCGRTGYLGRAGIYELLRFTPGVSELVDRGASVEAIRQKAVDEGTRLMWHDGLDKARVGLTTLEEVTKVASLVGVSIAADGRERREAAA